MAEVAWQYIRILQVGYPTRLGVVHAKRICQRVTGTNSYLSTAAVKHCPWSGGQSQVTPAVEVTTGFTISVGEFRHTLLSLDAGLCTLFMHFEIMTIITLLNKNNNQKN